MDWRNQLGHQEPGYPGHHLFTRRYRHVDLQRV